MATNAKTRPTNANECQQMPTNLKASNIHTIGKRDRLERPSNMRKNHAPDLPQSGKSNAKLLVFCTLIFSVPWQPGLKQT